MLVDIADDIEAAGRGSGGVTTNNTPAVVQGGSVNPICARCPEPCKQPSYVSVVACKEQD